MIFSELYSAYYNTVAAIISAVLDGERGERELQRIVTERAFGESVLTVMPSLKSEKWQLLHSDMTTALLHKPTMPLTSLQKRWLKAVLLDPRVKLFDVNIDLGDDVEPLFLPEDYVIYDKYSDGDDFLDEGYIERFKTVLLAIKNSSYIKIRMKNRNGRNISSVLKPLRLEYSEKDDKFRVVCENATRVISVNLGRLSALEIYTGTPPVSAEALEPKQDTLTLEIYDERNALERVMLHFAHFEKTAERIDKFRYLVKIKYEMVDATEIAIRVLSFGCLVKIIDSDNIKRIVLEKLKKQKKCGLK